jgi:uncharacterized RDD family membrane protein YckC
LFAAGLGLVGACTCVAAQGEAPADVGIGVAIALGFLAVYFWFAWWESGRRAATPGKRMLGLRVVDGRGRVIGPEAAFVRNAIRWLELLGPLGLLFSAKSMTETAGDVGLLAALLGLFALPFARADGRRLGDLVAGTIVVRNPKAVLRGELATERAREEFTFDPAALEIYGERELTALEALLRSATAHGGGRAAQAAQIIARKIGAPAPTPADSVRWLRAFYAAQRERLEGRLVLGRRKRDRHG